ncbi:hypothetical protein CP_0663 [Chlamydia pneumoniae AR39]|uniref:Uncharacterized protein n=1 Tax=Chlamydia pneumoniae TaxID=83558 RepID=Q9K222_CHLPN|nr:hypothetical protein CP_0663 [Chlamydia pneumoniae AR39]
MIFHLGLQSPLALKYPMQPFYNQSKEIESDFLTPVSL